MLKTSNSCSNNLNKPCSITSFPNKEAGTKEEVMNDSLSVLLFHHHHSSSSSSSSTAPTTPTKSSPTTPKSNKQQRLLNNSNNNNNNNEMIFGMEQEQQQLSNNIQQSNISSPFSVIQSEQSRGALLPHKGLNNHGMSIVVDSQQVKRADFNSPLPSLSPTPYTKLLLSSQQSCSSSSSSNGSAESLSSTEDGHCLYGSPKKPRTPTKQTFSTFDGFLTSQSCNSSMTSISSSGSRIYDPSTSPSILERRRSRTLASCDAYQKTIDDYLHIHNIENYIPTIINNSVKCIQVTLKIDSYIKGFENDVLTDCHPLEHECVSPTLSKTKKKEKPQFASVVLYKKNCKSKKHLETIFKTMILPPNSTTNITPNSCQDANSCDDCHSPESVKNVKKHYSYEITSKGFVKGNSSPSQSELLFSPSPSSNTYDQADTMMTSSSSESSTSTSSPTQSFFGSTTSLNRTLCVNEEVRQCTTPPPRLETLRKVEIPPNSRPRRLTIGSVQYAGEPYKPPVIHQIILTMKQRRNIRDLINIIDNNIRNDSFSIEGDWTQRLDFLSYSPDSFVLIRDQDFLNSIGEQFVGFSCFTYAAKKRRIDILKMLCKAQPSKVYENILLDIEQLEKIIELKDADLIKILITALHFHIENERSQNLKSFQENSEKKKKSSLSILLNRSHHNHEDDSIETESFMRKFVARNFIFVDNLNAVKVILEMNLISVQTAAKIASTMSKVNTLRFLLSKEIIKPCDYFDGGNVLHWSVLNRSVEVIQLVCGMRATKKGHRVNVKRSSSSRLQPFNGMTAFEIAKTIYNQNKLSDEEKLICEHLQPTKTELIKGVVEIVVHKVIH